MESLYENNIFLLKREYDFKIDSKQKSLDYLKNLVLAGQVSHSGDKDIQININGSSSSNSNLSFVKSSSNNITIQNKKLVCIQCNLNSVSENDKCGLCNNLICKSCSQSCTNTLYDHMNNNFCAKCFAQCVLCQLVKQCKACIKKCFSKNCQNTLCQSCVDKNKHQLRTDAINCSFYRCDSCQTDGNCIMTTLYCGPCDKRFCKNCFYDKHLAHKK
jgi:hypothetical protein